MLVAKPLKKSNVLRKAQAPMMKLNAEITSEMQKSEQ